MWYAESLYVLYIFTTYSRGFTIYIYYLSSNKYSLNTESEIHILDRVFDIHILYILYSNSLDTLEGALHELKRGVTANHPHHSRWSQWYKSNKTPALGSKSHHQKSFWCARSLLRHLRQPLTHAISPLCIPPIFYLALLISTMSLFISTWSLLRHLRQPLTNASSPLCIAPRTPCSLPHPILPIFIWLFRYQLGFFWHN